MRPMTSEIVIACTSRSRYFDLDAVRTEPAHDYSNWANRGGDYQVREGTNKGARTRGELREGRDNPAGAPPLDHWWHHDHTGPYPPPAERNPMSHATWHTGDALTVLRTLPTASIDLILTSPPFLALRSYLPADHPDKNLEMGSEGTPGAFLDALLDVVVECRRVLAPHGSLCVELGDTYANDNGDYVSGSAQEWHMKKGHRGTLTGVRRAGGEWPLAKSLTLIPETFRFALAYGRNPHTGRTLEPWRVRNVIRWCRPNPPVGALGDKVRPATSDIAIACTSRTRYFDLDVVREPYLHPGHSQVGSPTSYKSGLSGEGYGDDGRGTGRIRTENPAGAPPLDHWWHDDTFDQDAWHIPTHPFSGAHYATWPPDLCIKPILAMCPQRVCTTCGKPSERIVKDTSAMTGQPELAAHIRERRQEAGVTLRDVDGWLGTNGMASHYENVGVQRAVPTPEAWAILRQKLGLDNRFDTLVDGERRWTLSTTEYFDQTGRPVDKMDRVNGDFQGSGSAGKIDGGITGRPQTLGWSDCQHNTWRPGHVLDPFAGSGTTGVVATGHGRQFTGIDLDPRNHDLARQRIGMFLEQAEPGMAIIPTGDYL